MDYFAGYSFGWPGCGGRIAPFIAGVVVTPRYAKRLARERLKGGDDCDIMLDNGAWPAFRKGEILPVPAQVASMKQAERTLGALRWVVLPDVVGDAQGSLAAFHEAKALIGDTWPSSSLLRVVQDGADLGDMIRSVKDNEVGGLFVGGKSKAWKLEAAAFLARERVYVHVGRIATEKELVFCQESGVSSFDNTTFMRKQLGNVGRDYAGRMTKTCRRIMKPKTVLLCSGGVDSMVLSDWLLQRGGYNEVVHYFVDYGQPVAQAEREAARAQAARVGQPFVEDIIPLRGVQFEIEGANYIPNRNMVLVSMAANLAKHVGAGCVHYGATAEDYESYPDCRPGFVSLLSHLAQTGGGIVVKTPFVSSTRAQILKMATELGSHLEGSWSCYVGIGEQCGNCASCQQGAS